MHEHPVAISVDDDLHRNRATVFFRLVLAIPHLLWLLLWSVVVTVAAVVGWLAALATGRLPAPLHRFFCSYIRYSAHVYAYMTIAANPYPDFYGAGAYPVAVRLPEPGQLDRRRTFFRLVLAVPALLVSTTLLGTVLTGTKTNPSGSSGGTQTTGLGVVAAVLGWFASVCTGRMPRGLRDAAAYTIGFRSQVLAYLLLVTERYPNADPTTMLAGLERPPAHPVHVVGDAGELRRSRATVLLRLPLLVPLAVWAGLWGVLTFPVLVVQWLFMLAAGRPIRPLHRFLSRYVRFAFHVYAFASLAANPFPGLAGAPGSYPLDLVLPGPERQSRWKTLLRLVLAVPAYAVGAALGSVLVVDAILTWFASLATGRAPEGLRNLSAYALRYLGQTSAYVYLLTDAYPHASPLEGGDIDSASDDGEAPDTLALP